MGVRGLQAVEKERAFPSGPSADNAGSLSGCLPLFMSIGHLRIPRRGSGFVQCRETGWRLRSGIVIVSASK